MLARMSSICASGCPPAAWKRRTAATAGATASWRACPATTAPNASTGGGWPVVGGQGGRTGGRAGGQGAYFDEGASVVTSSMPARTRPCPAQRPAPRQLLTLARGQVGGGAQQPLRRLHVAVAGVGVDQGAVGAHVHRRAAVGAQRLKRGGRGGHLAQPAVRRHQRGVGEAVGAQARGLQPAPKVHRQLWLARRHRCRHEGVEHLNAGGHPRRRHVLQQRLRRRQRPRRRRGRGGGGGCGCAVRWRGGGAASPLLLLLLLPLRLLLLLPLLALLQLLLARYSGGLGRVAAQHGGIGDRIGRLARGLHGLQQAARGVHVPLPHVAIDQGGVGHAGGAQPRRRHRSQHRLCGGQPAGLPTRACGEIECWQCGRGPAGERWQQQQQQQQQQQRPACACSRAPHTRLAGDDSTCYAAHHCPALHPPARAP